MPYMLSYRLILAGIALLLFLFCPALSQAAGTTAGFRTIGWMDTDNIRMHINVWYPAHKTAKQLKFPPWSIRAASNAAPADGRHPVILLSHPSAGNRFSYHDTAASLAQAGFVVVAPTHPSDNMDNMPTLYTWQQCADRLKEIPRLISILEADEMLSPAVDTDRIGILGFGAGGTTALLIGGALPDCSAWKTFCQETDTDGYCSRWAKQRITDHFCTSLPLQKSPADTRVTAIAAVSPDFAILFPENSLRYFYPPLLLVVTPRDKINDAVHLRRLTQSVQTAKVIEIDGADQGAVMAPCPESLRDELPELCRSVTDEERTKIHAQLTAQLIAFFTDKLIDSPRPMLPAPPDLAPKPVKPQEVKKPAKTRKDWRRNTQSGSRGQ